MSTAAGKDGKFSAGSSPSVVGEVKSFNVTITAEAHRYGAVGKGSTNVVAGQKSANGSADLVYDPADAGQTEILAVGSKVDLTLHPQGDASGKPVITFAALIESVERTTSADGLVEASVTYSSDGDVTEGTVGS